MTAVGAIKIQKRKPPIAEVPENVEGPVDGRIAFLNERMPAKGKLRWDECFRVSKRTEPNATEYNRYNEYVCEMGKNRLGELAEIIDIAVGELKGTIRNLADAGYRVSCDIGINGHSACNQSSNSTIATILTVMNQFLDEDVHFSFDTYYGFYMYVWGLLGNIFAFQEADASGIHTEWFDKLEKMGWIVTNNTKDYEVRILVAALNMLHVINAETMDSDKVNSLGTITLEEAKALGVV